jgi:hypothetical protein
VNLLLKISERMHCVPITITLSLFIGFKDMINDWKVEEVNYKFGIGSFLRLYMDEAQKPEIFRLLKSDQPRNSEVLLTLKYHNF